MNTLLWLIGWLGTLMALAYVGTSLAVSAAVVAAALLVTTLFSTLSWFSLLLLWASFGGVSFCVLHPEYRKRYLVLPLFDKMSKNLPRISETESIALEAGTVSWDGELFSGTPQWEKLLTIPAPHLSEEERLFLEGPVRTLCESVNDWHISHRDYDLPENVWAFLKSEGFFGLIIPAKFGGKGFSEAAHSQILATLASRSLTLGITVSVPNSLGPAELLVRYGTPAQRDYYLPRLAQGLEIPCFALTSPHAGSDATAITDSGVICRGMFNNQEVIGIRLNWDKRYITLAPIATLIGLAFKLYDPDALLGDKPELGITCAIIPATTPGITIGRRHLPTQVPFQNGPTKGKDVFIPLDWIIGGPEMAGQGWRMLVECLSTGRAVSLPALSVGNAKLAVLLSSAYCQIRRQFRSPLANFEGIQEVLARVGGFTYLSEAIRRLTVSLLDMGEKPSVCGAIAKYHVTELSRKVANDTMDIFAGKAIMTGPNNPMIHGYQGVPIGITVEGANILTRNMIIFGQGSLRCHPFLMKEMQTLKQQNLANFEHTLGEHIRYLLSNTAKALFHGLTFSKFAHSPVSNASKIYFQQLARASSAFAIMTDAVLLVLGGKLKTKESLSARLADMLAMMYSLSAVLKYHYDQGSPEEDLPLVQWSSDYCLAQFWQALKDCLHNFPSKPLAIGLKLLLMPYGMPCHPPKDKLNQGISQQLSILSTTRARLIEHTFIADNEADFVASLEKAFKETLNLGPLLNQIYWGESLEEGIQTALESKMIHEKEALALIKLNQLYQRVIAVDDFSMDELLSKQSNLTERSQTDLHIAKDDQLLN